MTSNNTVGPLSHSSATNLLSCEQRYWHYKVNETPRDSDYFKSEAFSVGSAFHYIQHKGGHKKVECIKTMLDHCEKDEDILLPEMFRPLVHAMCVRYWRLHHSSKFTVLASEFELLTNSVIGYVDAIMEDTEGKWWIVDLKTARTVFPNAVSGLAYDPQLNLYASFSDSIASMFSLDIDKFAGCRWRIATKPTLKFKSSEDVFAYTKRLIKSVRTYDIEVPIDKMDPKGFRSRHEEYFKMSSKLYKPKAKPKMNYGNCMSYFRPCEYWSQCHGGVTYSDTHLNIIEGS